MEQTQEIDYNQGLFELRLYTKSGSTTAANTKYCYFFKDKICLCKVPNNYIKFNSRNHIKKCLKIAIVSRYSGSCSGYTRNRSNLTLSKIKLLDSR